MQTTVSPLPTKCPCFCITKQDSYQISAFSLKTKSVGINGIEFGNQGELYIQVGSNTNGGIPGPLTGKQIQKENYFSAATLVAKLVDPLFNGFITYDAMDNGTPNGGYGVKVFAAGTRNPFGIVMHSNGKLYGTENGPNLPYGNMMVGCGGQYITAVETEDKINLLQEGKYYGHPNAKRASVDNDPRQCTWRNPTSSNSINFTAPLLNARSSMNGIIEYKADHFDAQLRGNLIASKYTDGLFRIILTDDGLGVIPQSVPALELIGDSGLDVCQAPNGNLIEVRLPTNSLFYHRPVEAATTKIKILSVFPHRGPNTGGTKLNIYGVNLSGKNLAVKIGGKSCPIVTKTTTKLTCTIPGGTNGIVDVVVSSSTGTYTFLKGYRYISGF
jgi:IPT/TIG domain/Glucose / Sorbosone dehydrogenase